MSNKNLEDFLSDDEFLRWVKNEDPTLEEFWSKWLRYNPEMRETALLAKEIILSMENDADSNDPDLINAKEDILRNLLINHDSNSGDTERSAIRVNKGYFSILFKVAAVLIFCICIGFLYTHIQSQKPEVASLSETIIKENQQGRRQTMLPDGTMVWLNSNTRISYQSNMTELPKREVILEGEAFFKVTKDASHPFVVKSQNFSTMALGTAFNVNAYPQDNFIVVSLKEGKVLVEQKDLKDTSSYILTPNRQLYYSLENRKTSLGEFDPDVEIGWIDGLLLFKNSDFDEVTRRLEKFYTISIKIKGNKPTWNYSGRFHHASLAEVLERLSAIEQFDYSLKGETLTLWNK